MSTRLPPQRQLIDGRTLLRVTPDDCVAFGRPPVGFTLDLTGPDSPEFSFIHSPDPSRSLGYLDVSFFPSSDPNHYLSCSGPPGGPLMVHVVAVAGPDAAALEAIVRAKVFVKTPDQLRFGPLTRVSLPRGDSPALPFETDAGPAWRPCPGGCAVRFGPLGLILEAEGFCLDCAQVMAHDTLGAVAAGFILDS